MKFIISGTTATLVNFAILYSLTEFVGLWYLFSSIIAFALAVLVSFFLQKFWTFGDDDREKMKQQIVMYYTVATINLGLNTAGMFVLVERFGIWYIFAQVIMTMAISVEGFFAYKLLIFRKPKKEVKARGPEAPNNGLKVLIATGIYPPDIGGPATYARSLAKELVKLDIKVKILTYSDEREDGNYELGIRGNELDVCRINRSRNILIRYYNYLRQACKLAEAVDIVYILDLVSAGLPGIVAAKIHHKKIVFRTGGDFLWEKAFQAGWTGLPLTKYYQGKKSLKEKFLFWFCRSLLKRIDRILFSTRLQAEIYKNYYGVKEERSEILPNISPELSEIQPDKNYENSIVYAGRLIKLKNLERLIKAFNKVNSRGVRLIIFGEGPEGRNLKSLIKDLGAEDRISIEKKVSHRRLLEIISGAKFFILPSITDISPQLVLECLSLVKPVILTQETGLDKSLTERLITINPLSEENIKEGIENLLDKKNLDRYTDDLRKIEFEKRDWSDIAREYNKIFKEIINAKSSSYKSAV